MSDRSIRRGRLGGISHHTVCTYPIYYTPSGSYICYVCTTCLAHRNRKVSYDTESKNDYYETLPCHEPAGKTNQSAQNKTVQKIPRNTRRSLLTILVNGFFVCWARFKPCMQPIATVRTVRPTNKAMGTLQPLQDLIVADGSRPA